MTNKIAMIIASDKFRDEEYAQPKRIFENNGFSVTTASSSLDPSTGMLGLTVTPEVLYSTINPGDYDAVVFVGGGGSREYFDDQTAHNIAKSTVTSEKVLGAICIAPSILANAGLLQGKKATAYSSEEGNISGKGAILQNTGAVRDGRIVTADGPASADKFGDLIVQAIKSV
jgi:protease I